MPRCYSVILSLWGLLYSFRDRSLPVRLKQPAIAQTALHLTNQPSMLTDTSQNATMPCDNGAKACVTDVCIAHGPDCDGTRIVQDRCGRLEPCAPVASDDSGAEDTSASHYFDKKKAPLLTWWWELGSAYASVLLLPVIALVPGNTALAEDH